MRPSCGRVGAQLRQLLAGRVIAVNHQCHRPGREMLDQACQLAVTPWAPRRRLDQGYVAPKAAPLCTCSPTSTRCQPSPRVTSLPEDLDVVVLGVERAFVEALLERHHHSPTPPAAPLAPSGPPLFKHLTVCGLGQPMPTPLWLPTRHRTDLVGDVSLRPGLGG